MLVLTRKIGESLRIGDDIEVVITAIDQNKVKIGIRSPRHVPIYREELYRKIQEDNVAASGMVVGEMEAMLEGFEKERRAGAPNASTEPGK